ncbi:MAG TPA: pepsin/retropepsin-like aspartic protease family protein [Chthoniobacterales bacterium]|nr:pepsin/retropepsin-like aspartic protease family protein [Chthoniobacterales bacterium]
MRVKSVSLIAFLLSLSSLTSLVAESTKTGASLSSLLASYNFRSVHVEKAGSHLSLRVKINGKPTSLIIATAAPMSVLDRNSLRKFGLTERKTTIPLNSTLGKTSEYVGMSKVKGLEFANIVLADFDAGVIDESVLNRSLPPTAIHLDGVFGYSQMRKLGAVLDCGQRNLYVNPRGPSREASAKLEKLLTERGFTRVPMRFNAVGHPEVDCRVNGRASIVTVETAAFTTIIDKRLASEAGLSQALAPVDAEAVGRRKAPFSFAVMKDFSVGNFQTQGTKISVTDVSFNVLGIDYLSSAEAIIDSGSMNLFLCHRKNPTH